MGLSLSQIEKTNVKCLVDSVMDWMDKEKSKNKSSRVKVFS